jgi:hypothetical protein
MGGSMRKSLLVIVAAFLLVVPSAMGAVTSVTGIKNFIGLAADTKPTGVPAGSTFYAYDTNITFVTYDGTNWTPKEIRSIILPTTFDLNQAANTYDLFTATGGSVYVESFSFTMPSSPDVTDDATITSISIQTDTDTVIVLLSASAGAKANLIADTVFTYATPFALPVGKKIQLTIAGGAADASTVCTVSVRYQAVVPAGYLAP